MCVLYMLDYYELWTEISENYTDFVDFLSFIIFFVVASGRRPLRAWIHILLSPWQTCRLLFEPVLILGNHLTHSSSIYLWCD